MARISVLALFAVALVGFAQGNPFKLQSSLDNTPVHTASSWEYEDCGSEGDLVELKSISVSPDPPKPGQNLTVNILARAYGVIDEGAYADVTVKLGLIKLLHKQFDVCEEARNAKDVININCPVQAGDHNVTATVALPKEIPPAKFTVQIMAYSSNDDPLVCVNLKANFIPGR